MSAVRIPVPTDKIQLDGELVLPTSAKGVVLLTLSRPDRRNMWTATMEAEFYDCLDRAAADSAVASSVFISRRRRRAAPSDWREGPAALRSAASSDRRSARGRDPRGLP